MAEKRNSREIRLSEVITIGEFVKQLKERTGNDKLSNQTIHYHLANTDELDYIRFCGMKLVVLNDKAKNFNPGTFYGKNYRSTMSL